MASRSYKAIQVRSGHQRSQEDELVVEVPLQIIINGVPLSITMQTPGDEKQLVRGLLHSEDIYRSDEAPEMVFTERSETSYADIIEVTIPHDKLGKGYKNSRQLLSVSSCGICGRTDFQPRSGTALGSSPFDNDQIQSMMNEMRARQSLFEITGGSHGAAAFDKMGKLLTIKEDIGRHNAVDKVIGQLLMDQTIKSAQLLTVSGRLSYEIIAKTFMAGIPNVAAVSAPSSLAVDFAKELGIRLIAFTRGDRLTVYS